MAGLLGNGRAASAQDTAQPVYLITYIEIAPDSSLAARQLILAHSIDARKAPGAAQIDALQRIDYPNHFALVEHWQSLGCKTGLCLDRLCDEVSSSTRPVAKCRL
jgi:hypothetical protein